MNLKIICEKLISSFLILELLLASTLTKGADAKNLCTLVAVHGALN